MRCEVVKKKKCKIKDYFVFFFRLVVLRVFFFLIFIQIIFFGCCGNKDYQNSSSFCKLRSFKNKTNFKPYGEEEGWT